MRAKPVKVLSQDAMKWTRQPVAVILNDGTYYVGWVTDVNQETLTLSGQQGSGKMNKALLSDSEKVKLSAFLPGNESANAAETGGWADMFGFSPVREGPQAGEGNGWGGFGGFMGFVKQVWPGIQIGLGIVKAVMPLMRGFKL